MLCVHQLENIVSGIYQLMSALIYHFRDTANIYIYTGISWNKIFISR